MGDVHGLNEGGGDEASLHCSVACEGLWQEYASQGDCITRLYSSREIAPQLY